MTNGIPDGMVPMSGVMRYTAQDGGRHQLTLSHGHFMLMKRFHNGQAHDGLGLDILVATHPVETDDEYRTAPAITTEWLDIDEADLLGRGRDALHRFRYTYDAATSDSYESPAALQDESYGSIDKMRIELTHNGDDSYRLEASFTDEFNRQAEIKAELPLFRVWLGTFTDGHPAIAENWIAQHFDASQLEMEWRQNGSSENSWNTLSARFKEA